MPRTRSIAWSELKVGIAGALALLLVTVLVFAVGGEGGFWWQRYPLKARFSDVEGLKAGAVVRLNGKEVGTVTAVEFAGAEVEVDLELLDTVRPLVTTASTAEIGSLSLLGEPIVEIVSGAGGTPLGDGEVIPSRPPSGSISQLTESASAGLQQLDDLLSEIRAGRGTLGRFITDDALYQEMRALIAAAEQVTASINSGGGTLGNLIRNPEAYEAMRGSLQNLETVTARMNSGEGALGRFLHDEAMGRSMSGAITNFEQVTGRLSRGEGTAGRLLTDQELYDRLTGMAARVDEVMARLDDGEGTAGRLLQDDQLYENMNGAVTELRDLLAAIRSDPQKYLRVRVSIF